MKQILYVGAYTTYPPAAGARAEGLAVFQMDVETGHLECVQTMNAGENPSFLTLSKDGSALYVANEIKSGGASAFSVDSSGRLQPINRQAVEGDDPCYLTEAPDRKSLFVACYSSGSLTVLPIGENGALQGLAQRIQHNGSGPNTSRQEKAHVHSVVPAPGGQYFFVADLGMDRVWIYRYDSAAGLLDTGQASALQTAPGAGPRHLAVHPDGQVVYLSNELDSTVTACKWDGENGRLGNIQTLSTLPADFDEENFVADIHITPDGKMLYVSNRGHNSLAAFQLDPESGQMRSAGFYPCGGKWPRNFAIDPTGRFLLIANQFSGNVVVLRIEADGALTPTGEGADVLAPVCIVFGRAV